MILHRRLQPVLPLIVFFLLLGVGDIAVRSAPKPEVLGESPEVIRWVNVYREFQETYDQSRPYLIVIGSSRGREAVSIDDLQSAIRDHGLPHRALNMSIGGGGTPALFVAALTDLAKVESPLPDGSLIVYLYSDFELAHLQPEPMRALRTGRDWLARYGYIDKSHPAEYLSNISGFARYSSQKLWKALPSDVFVKTVSASTTPIIQHFDTQECNQTALLRYRPLPINKAALAHLSSMFAGQLIVVRVPVSSRQNQLDEKFRIRELAQPVLDEVAASTPFKFVKDFGSRAKIGDEAFLGDCDHITELSAHRDMAEAIVELLE